jgi:hypothetical protein
MKHAKSKLYRKPYLRELWGVHQLFRRLGFEPEDMFVGLRYVVNAGPDCLVFQLKTQDKEFNITVAYVPGAVEEVLLKEWADFVTTTQTQASDRDLTKLLSQATLGRSPETFLRLISTLLDRGFAIPIMPLSTEAVEIFQTVFPAQPLRGTQPGGNA